MPLTGTGAGFLAALVSALWDNCEIGNPLLLSHDLISPIGWSRTVTVHMEPGLSRLVGQHLIPENEDEVDRLASMLNGYLQAKLVNEYEEEVERLRSLPPSICSGRQRPFVEVASPWWKQIWLRELYLSSSLRETRTPWCPSVS